MNFLVTTLGRLRAIGFLEGLSFIVLLGIAMPLKYFAGRPEAVRVVGMAHGLLFLLYLGATVQAALEYRWTWKRTLVIAAASLIPFGPFYVDAKFLRDSKSAR
ncbi:MAG TPA: DUF3817 domain-containing protein [Opitutaceae bacterium]